MRRWLALLPFGDKAPEGLPPLESGYGVSSLIVITHHCTDALAEKIAEAEPFFSAVTLVLVGEGHGEKLDLPVLRLEVGCDVADALAALE